MVKLEIFEHKLQLRDRWTIARGTSDFKHYNYVRLECDGITGYGEAAHNARYGESLETTRAFLEQARALVERCDPREYHHLIASLHALAPDHGAAKAALDMAILDLAGKMSGLPLYRVLGLSSQQTPITSYSIGIDNREAIQKKIEAAADFPILKIKLGSDHDREIIAAVRAVTDRTLRVDANEGWHDMQHAIEMIRWLADQNVEFVEQPMPAGNLPDVAWLREHSPLPLIADEEVKTSADVASLAQAYDGINLKIMKAGGVLEVLHMITMARTHGLKIMLGCMIESSLGITAAAHLTPLVDWADLDGNLLIANDPFAGVTVSQGRLILPEAPGLGAAAITDIP